MLALFMQFSFTCSCNFLLGGSKLTRACTHKACVEAAKACIQARLHQATLGSWQAAQDNTTIYVTVGVERVGLIVGPQGSVIQNIAATTGTSIISPRKGQDPVFVITGTKRAVEAAREVCDALVSACGRPRFPHSHSCPKVASAAGSCCS